MRISLSGSVRATPAFARAVAERTCPPSILSDIVRLSIERLLDGITLAAPLPPGPRLYLANHQTGFDLLFLGLPLAALADERFDVLVWSGFRFLHYGEMLLPLIERTDGGSPALADSVRLAVHETHIPEAAGRAIRGLLEDLLSGRSRRSILAAPEGILHRFDGQPVGRVSSGLLDLAIEARLPVVPVRIAWGLPEVDGGTRHLWPHRLAPLHIFLGEAIAPGELSALPLGARRRRVADAVNALGAPAPPGHRERNAAMAGRVAAIARDMGMSETKAILIDLLLSADPVGLTEEGRLVADFIVSGARSPLALRTDWLYAWALSLSDGMMTTDLAFDVLYGPRVI